MQRTSLDNQTDIALKILFWFGLKLYDFSRNLFRNILVRNIFSHMTPGSRNVIILVMWLKFYFSEMLASTKLWFLKAPSFLFSKSAINYLSNKWSTVSIRRVDQNLWTFPFLTKIIEIMTSLYKMLTSLRKRSSGRNFGMVLYIKSYLTLKKNFSFLSTSLRILRMGASAQWTLQTI